MAEDDSVCLAQAQEFRLYATKFLSLACSNDECSVQDISDLLDSLNSIDYTFELAEIEEAEHVLCQGTHLISQSNEVLVIKFCKLVTNIINKQKITPTAGCLTALLEYFIGALRVCPPQVFPQILTALGALLYEPKNKFEEYWDYLAGPDGILIKLVTSDDIETKRTALKCLENFTFRNPGEPCIGGACVETCFKIFLRILQSPSSDIEDAVYCRMLISVLRGMQNVIANSKNIHMNNLGSLLALLKKFTFHGLPGHRASTPQLLQPTSLHQSEATELEGEELQPTHTSRIPNQSKKSKRKAPPRKVDSRAWQMLGDAPLPSDSNVDAYVDPLSSIWTPKLNRNNVFSQGDEAALSSSWTKISSSESEYSDAESEGHSGKMRIFQAKVRATAHLVLLSIVKNTEKKIIMGYLTTFLPDSPLFVGVPQTETLLTSILKDPSPKVRTSALAVLIVLLDGSKQYLASADDSERHYMAFTPFSMTVAMMIKELLRCLLLALIAETSPLTLTQLIKCLSTCILNVPFQKLSSGLLTKLVRHLKQFLSHRDSNVRVACLTSFGSMLSLQPPMAEIAQILTDESKANAYSVPTPDEVICNPAKTKDSSPTDSKSIPIEMHQAFNAMIGSLNLGKKEPWLLRICQENVYAENMESLEGETITKNIPLPVRLESLQVLANLAKGYFFILRWHLNKLAGLVHACLLDPEASVRLHGARLFEQLGQAMLLDLNLNGNSSNPLYPPDYVPISVEEIVSVWLHLLDGALPSALQNASLPPLRATGCDCLANIGPRSFELLPTDYRGLCTNLLLSLTADTDNSVKAESVRALGVYVLFPCFKEDINFLADAANAIITTMEDANVNVRIKACWALGNLSDAFVLNRTKGNDLFVEELSDRLLYKLCTIAVNAANDNDKVKSNAVRAIGNLLRFMGEKTVAKGNFLQIIDQSVQTLIKNITSGNNMKVRWNACYAVGNFLRNPAIPFGKNEWMSQVMKGLTTAIKECKNFKVRVNAALALMVPTARIFYGTCEEFSSLWEDICLGLEVAQHSTSFTEYNYQDNLIDQLCFALCHLTSLIEANDFDSLYPISIKWQEQLQTWIKKFKENISPEKEVIIQKSIDNLQFVKEAIGDDVQQIVSLFTLTPD